MVFKVSPKIRVFRLMLNILNSWKLDDYFSLPKNGKRGFNAAVFGGLRQGSWWSIHETTVDDLDTWLSTLPYGLRKFYLLYPLLGFFMCTIQGIPSPCGPCLEHEICLDIITWNLKSCFAMAGLCQLKHCWTRSFQLVYLVWKSDEAILSYLKHIRRHF